MEAEHSCIDLHFCTVHNCSKNENDTPEEVKLVGSAHDSRQEREGSPSIADEGDSSRKITADVEMNSKRRDFPSKLYEMLHDSQTQGREHIISWDPDGKSFKVHQPEAFVTEVMPKYFNQTKYRSFQRMVGATIAHACTRQLHIRLGNMLFH